MPLNIISASLTTANKNDIKTHLDGVKSICSFFVNLTPEDRKKIYKMGSRSVAFVSGVLSALKATPAVVPTAFPLSEFENDYQLYLDLQFILDLLRPLVEGVEDTLMAVGSDLMREGVSGYKLIAGAAKSTSALDSIAKELGVRFKRGSKTQPTAFSLKPRETLTLHGVVPNRLFRTLNQSMVLLYRGEGAIGKYKTVGGKSQIKIPTGWTVMTIFNHDQTEAAIFSLIQK